MDKPDELDVLMAIDNLRRDLSGYHGQLKAYSDMKKHSERQRERIATLEGIHARDKAENERLEQEMMTRCGECVAMLDCDECLRADADHKARKALAYKNEKLRELLQDVAICACGRYCYGCPHQNDGCDRDQRLREFGIEVDE